MTEDKGSTSKAAHSEEDQLMGKETELKLMASLSFVETVDLSEEVSNRLADAWLELRKTEGGKADYAALSDKLRPQIRQQVLLEMIAAKEVAREPGEVVLEVCSPAKPCVWEGRPVEAFKPRPVTTTFILWDGDPAVIVKTGPWAKAVRLDAVAGWVTVDPSALWFDEPRNVITQAEDDLPSAFGDKAAAMQLLETERWQELKRPTDRKPWGED